MGRGLSRVAEDPASGRGRCRGDPESDDRADSNRSLRSACRSNSRSAMLSEAIASRVEDSLRLQFFRLPVRLPPEIWTSIPTTGSSRARSGDRAAPDPGQSRHRWVLRGLRPGHPRFRIPLVPPGRRPDQSASSTRPADASRMIPVPGGPDCRCGTAGMPAALIFPRASIWSGSRTLDEPGPPPRFCSVAGLAAVGCVRLRASVRLTDASHSH